MVKWKVIYWNIYSIFWRYKFDRNWFYPATLFLQRGWRSWFPLWLFQTVLMVKKTHKLFFLTVKKAFFPVKGAWLWSISFCFSENGFWRHARGDWAGTQPDNGGCAPAQCEHNVWVFLPIRRRSSPGGRTCLAQWPGTRRYHSSGLRCVHHRRWNFPVRVDATK